MPSARSSPSSKTREVFLYFSLLSLLVNLVQPQYLLDIPTSYMLKNLLHASASQVSIFRLITAIPLFLGFVFGMARDLWNPFGRRDPGYFVLFVPVMVLVLAWMGLSRTSYAGLLIGMLLVMISYSFLFAAFQGLMALIGQEALMAGRLSVIANSFNCLPVAAAFFASGFMTEHLSPLHIFFLVLALTAPVGIFGFWKPCSVFSHTYENPRAQGGNFLGDVKRLLKHRAVYPVVLLNLLWNFAPGVNTPMQFYLTNDLHASDAKYASFLGILNLAYIPTFLLYGFLCTRFPPRKLLWWSVLAGLPQYVPLAFIHTAHQALLLAVPIGLMGGLASAALIDLAIRACPPGQQGTMMMLINAVLMLAARCSDVVGSWLFGLSAKYGFQLCMLSITVVYALLLPVIPFVPKQITATADGQPNPEAEAAVVAEIGDLPTPAWE